MRGAFVKWAVLGVWAAGVCTGCADQRRSALDPGGIQAERIHTEWMTFLWISIAIYVAVMIFFLLSLIKRRNSAPDARVIPPEPAREKRMLRTIIGALVISVVILFVFLLVDLFTGQAIAAMPADPLTIKITGHQWWWEVRYQRFPGEPNEGWPHGVFTAANEIHIPVGQPVLFELESQDVNHSFWVPSLNGKKDLIPGQHATMWLEADRAGTFMGQCAEYCGAEHANMLLWVIAEPKESFDAWVRGQRESAGDPELERLKRGRAVFLGTSCVLCHTVEGTPAHGRAAPDLTHVASRQRIAAGALTFSRENLAQWIVDPQSVKPGVKMPQNSLAPDDLQALLDWMQTLK